MLKRVSIQNFKSLKDVTLDLQSFGLNVLLTFYSLNVTANSLESTGKDDTKRKVYGEKNPARRRIEKVVSEAATKADFVKLAKQSRSFAHFHKQVTDFLTQYNKTTQT